MDFQLLCLGAGSGVCYVFFYSNIQTMKLRQKPHMSLIKINHPHRLKSHIFSIRVFTLCVTPSYTEINPQHGMWITMLRGKVNNVKNCFFHQRWRCVEQWWDRLLSFLMNLMLRCTLKSNYCSKLQWTVQSAVDYSALQQDKHTVTHNLISPALTLRSCLFKWDRTSLYGGPSQ